MLKEDKPLPSKRRSIWPYIVVGLLAAHVTGIVIAVTITESDKTFLVVPDYYDKAQHWDKAKAEVLASSQLGWHVAINPAANFDARGNRAVKFLLTDAQQQALPGATLEVEYFHHAHPDQQRKVQLTADASDPTVFAGTLNMPYTGVWEFHVTAHAVDKTFTQTQTPYVQSQKLADAPAK